MMRPINENHAGVSSSSSNDPSADIADATPAADFNGSFSTGNGDVTTKVVKFKKPLKSCFR